MKQHMALSLIVGVGLILVSGPAYGERPAAGHLTTATSGRPTGLALPKETRVALERFSSLKIKKAFETRLITESSFKMTDLSSAVTSEGAVAKINALLEKVPAEKKAGAERLVAELTLRGAKLSEIESALTSMKDSEPTETHLLGTFQRAANSEIMKVAASETHAAAGDPAMLKRAQSEGTALAFDNMIENKQLVDENNKPVATLETKEKVEAACALANNGCLGEEFAAAAKKSRHCTK